MSFFKESVDRDLDQVKAKINIAIQYAINRQLSRTYASAQVWIASFRKHRDGAACKNLALALGKISGVMMVATELGVTIDTDMNHIPEECTKLWDELGQVYLERRDL